MSEMHEDENTLELLMKYGYPRLMAFIHEHEGRLSTENGVHWVSLKLDDVAALFIDEIDRRMNRV